MRSFLRNSSLSIFFGAIFLIALVGQAFAGLAEFNASHRAEGLGEIDLLRYVTSADFAVDVSENWQSEYLQFTLMILFTVWLVQRGSPESKEPEQAGRQSDKDQKVAEHADPDSPGWARVRGIRLTLFSWSLTLTMGLIFVASWFAQSVGGWAAYNEVRLERLQDPLTWPGYLGSPDFWSRSLQNWQSEFLAVGSMAVLSIYLRQRGSAESKPVGEAHHRIGG